MLQAKTVELTDALRNFTFPTYPDQFRSQGRRMHGGDHSGRTLQQARSLVTT
jgi:hypothetical protein